MAVLHDENIRIYSEVSGGSKKTKTLNFFSYLFIPFFFIAFFENLQASVTISSVQSGNWSDAATWSNNNVPGSFDNVIIQNGHTVLVNNNYNCASLTINVPSGIGITLLEIDSGKSFTVFVDIDINADTSNSHKAYIVVNGSGILTIGRNLNIISNAKQCSKIDMSSGSSILNLGGALNVTGSTTWKAGNESTVNFNGNVPQLFPTSLGLKFHHVTFNNTSTDGVFINADITSKIVSGDIRIQSGIFNNKGYSITGKPIATFEAANGTKFILQGSSSFPSAYNNIVLGVTSTVQYDGNGPQTIEALNYGNLISSNTGNRTLPNGKIIGAAGTFTPGSNSYNIAGSTVNFNGAASQTITKFNYYNLYSSNTGNRLLPSGQVVRVAGVFSPGINAYTITGSTIEFNGTGTQTIPVFNYFNLKSSSTGNRIFDTNGIAGIEGAFTPGTNNFVTQGSTLEFKGLSTQIISAFNYYNLSSSNSGIRVLDSNGIIRIAKTFTLGSNTYQIKGSTVDFNGTTPQVIPAFSFENLQISNNNVSLLGDITIGGNLIINGILDGKNGTINLAADWVNNGTFINGGQKVVLQGINNQSIAGASSTTFGELLVNKSSGNVTINKPVLVNIKLTLTNGIVFTTSANKITLQPNAVLGGGSSSSFVNGPLTKITNSTSAFIFPTGKKSIFRTVRIDPLSVDTTAFTTEYFDSAFSNTTNLNAGIDHVSKIEYFQIDRSGSGLLANARVTLSWDGTSKVNSTHLADLRVAKWDGTKWLDLGNSSYTGDSLSGSVTSNIVSAFSPFTFGSSTGNNPLPIELLSFHAKPYNNTVLLSWETASEINNDFFSLERSTDAINFYKIGEVDGSGTSVEPVKYFYVDENPFQGISYYRLKQTDFDGSYEYFPAIAVEINEEEAFTLTIFPNPVLKGNDVYVGVNGISNNEVIKLKLLNWLGEEIDVTEIYKNSNYLISENLSAGTYFMKVVEKNGGGICKKILVL